MKALLRTAAIVLSAILTTPAFAYYDDVHFALTYYMARRCGYTAVQSYRIASACSATDWDEDTEPVQGGNQAWLLFTPFEGAAQDPRWKFHAMRNEREYENVLGKSPGGEEAQLAVRNQRDANWNYALNTTKNPGVFLHAFQDEAPHRGYGTKWGHWPMLPGCVEEYKSAGLAIGGTTDWISYRPQDVLMLTEQCWGYLQKFMDKNSPYQLWRPYDDKEYSALVNKLASLNPYPRPISTELQRQIYVQFYAKAFGVSPRWWQNMVNPDELSAIGSQLGVTLSQKELDQQKTGPNVEVAIDAVNAALKNAGFKDSLPHSHFKYDLDKNGALENEYMEDDWYLTGSLQLTYQGTEPVTATLKMSAAATGKEYTLPQLQPVKLMPGQPYKWDNLPLGDLVVSMEKKDGKVVRGEVLLDRRLSTYEIRIKGGGGAAPAANGTGTGALWICKGPRAYGESALGLMKENEFLPPFSANGGGASYADPGGGMSGSATWGGIQNSYREGDEVSISMSCTQMILSGNAFDCADGKSRSYGVRDPWDPPRASQTVKFIFKPRPGKTTVGFNFRAVPSNSKAYYSCGAQVAWTFEKAPAGAKPPANTPAEKESVQVTRKDPPRAGIIPKDKPPVTEPTPPDPEIEKPKIDPGNPPVAGGAAPAFNGAPLTFKEWENVSDGGGGAKVANGVVTLSAQSASGGEVSSFSKTPLKGDFDISFDYEMVKWNPQGENILSLDMTLATDPVVGADDYVEVSLVSTGESHQFMITSTRAKAGDEPIGSKLTPGPAKSGRLRVRRSGSTWTFYTLEGSSWKSMGSLKYNAGDETYIGFTLVQQDSPGAAEVKFKMQKNGG